MFSAKISQSILIQSATVQSWCRPFFKNMHYSFFDYGRYYSTGQFWGLTSHRDSFNMLSERRHPLLSTIKNNLHSENKTYHYFFPVHHEHYHDLSAHALRVDHFFVLLTMSRSYLELFSFSTPLPLNVAINHYINHVEELKKITRQFKFENAKLFKEAEKNCILLPKSIRPQLKMISSETTIDELLLQKITNLTQREKTCLDYLCKGYTTKQVAKILKLSPRTIETHTNNIKYKMGIPTLSEIRRFFLENCDFTDL